MAEPKTITVNRKARHDYHIDETVEAGLVLTGSEVKSLRDGGVNLKDSFARIRNGKATLMNVHISPYDPARDNHDPTRSRTLLLHQREIERLESKLNQRGLTLIPLRLYFNARGIAKVELGLGRGKREYDKRHALKEREAKREAERAMRVSRR